MERSGAGAAKAVLKFQDARAPPARVRELAARRLLDTVFRRPWPTLGRARARESFESAARGAMEKAGEAQTAGGHEPEPKRQRKPLLPRPLRRPRAGTW